MYSKKYAEYENKKELELFLKYADLRKKPKKGKGEV